MHAHVVTARAVRRRRRRPGLLLWQDFPLQWGYARGMRKQAVRQAREMVDLLGHHPSIALWCAHNEPLAVDVQPGEPMPTPEAAADRRRRCSSRRGTRTCSTARSRVPCTGPTRAARWTRTRACSPGSGARAPTPTSTSAGTTDARRARARAPARCRGSPASSPSSAPRRCREPADFMEPERWPDLDWDRLFERHALPEGCSSTATCRRPSLDSFDDVARRDPGYQAALIQLQVEDLRRLKYEPDRRVLPLLLRRRAPGGHLVGARPRPRAQARVRRAPRRLPAGPPDARAPHRPRPRRERDRRVVLPDAVVDADVAGDRGSGTGPETSPPTRSLHRHASTPTWPSRRGGRDRRASRGRAGRDPLRRRPASLESVRRGECGASVTASGGTGPRGRGLHGGSSAPSADDADRLLQGHRSTDPAVSAPAATRCRSRSTARRSARSGSWRSPASIGMGFVLAHMIGNLKLYLEGASQINLYGEWLRDLGEPPLPTHRRAVGAAHRPHRGRSCSTSTRPTRSPG